MNKYYKYDTNQYKFNELVKKIYDCELENLHSIKERDYNLFTEIGNDSNTEFHNKFYENYRNGWDDLVNTYKRFVYTEIYPLVKKITGETEFAYQTFPSFRVQLPNNVAVVKYHYDSDDEHCHPEGEINFVLALTKMFDTNTIWAESLPFANDFTPLKMDVGEYVCWNFNKCHHGNKINETGCTRVSFDFRILPLSKYTSDNITKASASTNTKFKIGNYYSYLSQDVIDNFNKLNENSISTPTYAYWDREKRFFDTIVEKYELSDPWDIVDLFEKKVAEYAGSKYAVAVDNCTDGLFLCLKYLKATGEVIIPSKTYVSVPCTIIHAGCKVKFEDVSGVEHIS